MKKKYFISILIMAIIVFAMIELFSKNANEETTSNIVTENTVKEESKSDENIINSKDKAEENVVEKNEVDEKSETNNQEKITNGEELINKAKTITASGWAGAANNIIGLKDGILYYNNKGTGEFEVLSEGVEDIYSKTEVAEEITAKKGKEFKEIKEKPMFVKYE